MQTVASMGKLTNKYVDKFGGHITAINNLQTSNKAEQKLYPSGDVSSLGFVDKFRLDEIRLKLIIINYLTVIAATSYNIWILLIVFTANHEMRWL